MWLTGWGFRKEITVQDTNIDGALTDFPVLIKLSADEDIGDEARADGYDIRFTQSDGETLLKYERVYWTGGAGGDATAFFYVKTNLAASGGATIYLYYGKADAGDGADPTNVWTSATAAFKGIWHGKDATTSTIADSLGGNTGTKGSANNPLEANGKIHKAQYFDDQAEYIDCGTSNDFDVTGGTMSWSLWLNYESDNPDYPTLLSRIPDADNAGYAFMLNQGGSYELAAYADGGSDWDYTDDPFPADQWVYVHLELTGGTLSVYWNGVLVDTLAFSHNGGDSGLHTYIGSSFPGWELGWTGWIEEVRIGQSVRGANWIKFEYNNVNEADNELTWGNEEAASSDTELVVSGCTHAHAAEAPVLSQLHNLAVQDSGHFLASESPALFQAHQLAVAEAFHALLSDSPVLSQVHSLIVNSALHGLTSESPTLAQLHNLIVNGADHALLSDIPSLFQAHTLAVTGADHALSSDAPLLSQAHMLAVAEALHAHGAESPALLQVHVLSVNGADHSLTSEAPVLFQVHSLAVNDSVHSVTSETPTLFQAHVLIVAEANHTLSSDEPVLSISTYLVVQDALHSHGVESPVLSQAHVLAIAEALHSLSSDTPGLIQQYTLAIQEAFHALASEEPVLSLGTILLVVDSSVHAISTDSPLLSQVYNLVVQNSVHAHSADTIELIAMLLAETLMTAYLEKSMGARAYTELDMEMETQTEKNLRAKAYTELDAEIEAKTEAKHNIKGRI